MCRPVCYSARKNCMFCMLGRFPQESMWQVLYFHRQIPCHSTTVLLELGIARAMPLRSKPSQTMFLKSRSFSSFSFCQSMFWRLRNSFAATLSLLDFLHQLRAAPLSPERWYCDKLQHDSQPVHTRFAKASRPQ